MGDRFVKVLVGEGQVTIPEPIRRAHGLEIGDDVLVELHGRIDDGELQDGAYDVAEDQTDLEEFDWVGDDDQG